MSLSCTHIPVRLPISVIQRYSYLLLLCHPLQLPYLSHYSKFFFVFTSDLFPILNQNDLGTRLPGESTVESPATSGDSPRKPD